MLVSCCVRSGTIFSHRNVNVLPYEASVESERRQRGGSSAGSAHRWEDRRGGSNSRFGLCCLCAVVELTSRRGRPFETETLKGSRHAGDSHPSKRRGCGCGS